MMTCSHAFCSATDVELVEIEVKANGEGVARIVLPMCFEHRAYLRGSMN